MGSKASTLHAPEALSGTPLGDFAVLYAALSRQGIGPTQADEMEVWQAAAALGLDMSDDHHGDGPPPPGALSKGRVARIAARRRAKQEAAE